MEKKLIPNSTQIPNIILDFLLPRLPEAEGKCLLYIARRTYGFHKDEDRISLTQFENGIQDRNEEKLDYGTGLARPTIVEGLKNLNKVKLVFVKKNKRENVYKINLNKFGGKLWKGEVEMVVSEINQLRKLTNIGKKSKPRQVRIANIQNKGNKGNKDIIIKSFKNGNERRLIPVGDPPEEIKDQAGLAKYHTLKDPVVKKLAII
jgi:hypothetical protein